MPPYSLVLLLLAFVGGPMAAAAAAPGEDHGWAARHEPGGVERVAAAAFAVGEGETLAPALPASGTRSVFEGELRLELGGEYRFGVEAAGGTASIEVLDERGAVVARAECAGGEGVALSEWCARPRSVLHVVVTFQREGAAAARLRSLWERKYTADGGFPLEPIPTRMIGVPAALATAFVADEESLRGRLLLEEHGCTSCHAPSAAESTAVGRREAPRLDGAGERWSLEWLRSWILDPARHRPGAAMPALLASAGDPTREALALAHFLARLGDPASREPAAWSASSEAPELARGRRLYHTIGCVACHGALASPAAVFGDELHGDERPELSRAPLDAMAGKWRPAALADFLRDPLVTRPDGRMPSLDLDEEEAHAVAAYLLGRFGAGAPLASSGAPLPADPAAPAAPGAASAAPATAEDAAAQLLADEGRALFVRRGCVACHALESVELPAAETATPPALAALDPARGCLDPTDRATPRYDLDAAERAALAVGLRAVRGATGARAPLDETRRALAALDCRACHVLDGEGGVPAELDPFFVSSDERVDLGDEGRLPPDLWNVGFKLRTSWLREVLEDGARARPYLEARMPAFGAAAAELLAPGLARREGLEPDADAAAPEASHELVLAGRDLLAHENLGCMACHVYKDYPATGSPGADVTRFGERLRYEWYRDFLQNPQRFLPGSRMPDFGTGGLSSLRTAFEGDMARQADAMWAYFRLGELMAPPEGVEPGGGLPLLVGERPRVLRAFLEDAGSRGIAVGLSVGVHFAFDAERCRLAYAWGGDFLDASGSWAGRGGTELDGQGPVVWRAPEGPAFLRAGDALPAATAAGAAHAETSSHGAEAGGADAGAETAPSPWRFRGYRLEPGGHPLFLYECEGLAPDAPITVNERCDARLAPELVILRSFEVLGLPAGNSLRFHAGPGSRVVRAAGATVASLPSADGEGWFEVRQGPGGRLALEVEVRP